MQDFKKLRAWHVANELMTQVVNRFSGRGSRRVPGLRAQAIRSANSIKTNIAEGSGRSSRPEFLHFIDISLSSTNELEDHLCSARDNGVITAQNYDQLYQRLVMLRRMLISLSRAVQ